ncbi:hypothetical protein ACHAWX_004920 [Stephanocyclus meneghinianus]
MPADYLWTVLFLCRRRRRWQPPMPRTNDSRIATTTTKNENKKNNRSNNTTKPQPSVCPADTTPSTKPTIPPRGPSTRNERVEPAKSLSAMDFVDCMPRGATASRRFATPISRRTMGWRPRCGNSEDGSVAERTMEGTSGERRMGFWTRKRIGCAFLSRRERSSFCVGSLGRWNFGVDQYNSAICTCWF